MHATLSGNTVTRGSRRSALRFMRCRLCESCAVLLLLQADKNALQYHNPSIPDYVRASFRLQSFLHLGQWMLQTDDLASKFLLIHEKRGDFHLSLVLGEPVVFQLFSDTTSKQCLAPLWVLQGLMDGYVGNLCSMQTGFRIRADLLWPVNNVEEIAALFVQFELCLPDPQILAAVGQLQVLARWICTRSWWSKFTLAGKIWVRY